MFFYSCLVDAVKGKVANMIICTVPSLLVLLGTIVLYILTWYRIQKEEPQFNNLNGEDAPIIRASHRAARNMSLFVAAFIVQWWAATISGVWFFVTDHVSIVLFQVLTIFTNSGGILNILVYLIIRRRNSAVDVTSC